MESMEIIPLVGVKIGSTMLALSNSQEDIENVLGTPYSTREKSIYYFDNELRFDFDTNGKIEFIEFLGGIDGKIQPLIYGIYAFQIEADNLYNTLVQENNGDINDDENGYSYGFLNISVGVFRDIIPEVVQEMIEEAEEDGEPMNVDDIEYEMRKANHWATIGIGIENYYR